MKAKLVALVRGVLDQKVPGEAKESIVAILENYRAEYSHCFMCSDEEEYKKLYEREGQLYKEIVALLPEGKRQLTDNFRSAVMDVLDMEIRFSYKNGLRDGLLLAMELLAESKLEGGIERQIKIS